MSKQYLRKPARTLKPVAQAVALAMVAMAGLAPSPRAVAGPGFVDVTLQDGSTGRIQTFFAYSPSGERVTPVTEANDLSKYPSGQNTGTALRKFVDPLPLPGRANMKLMADGSEKYIPVAVATKWVNPQGTVTGDDYYEIALVEYTERFHTDLRKATTLRGYVQLDHEASNGRAALPGSRSIPLLYPDGSMIMIAGTDANGKLTGSQVQAIAFDAPHYLGPVITATKDVPTRLKFHNLLPTGRAELGAPDANGKPVVTRRNGDIFLPLDKTIVGAGIGPDGVTEYTQNRSQIHLHGGDTPWISDGTPHQWITPIGEADATKPLSLAAAFSDPAKALDPALLPQYLRGASAANVPDMYDPGPGAVTYYYPNGQTARFMWYHDHTFGATRLNVYAGMASAYLLTDDKEKALIANGTLPPADRTIPLVLQDRTFVPDDIALQDGAWNTSAWGAPGDSWFPHVYETVQDPLQANNWNAVGRWHYGPYFWPVFPSLYALPTGEYSVEGAENTVTTTPEAWMDTPIINGVAYPTMEVDPTTYRFRILNASNDRLMTFNLFEAKTDFTLADGTLLTSPGGATEIDMVPAAAVLPTEQCPAGQMRPTPIGLDKVCTPTTWPTDNRLGGVPDPRGVGPTLYQVASEGGWLPKVVAFEPSPITYIQDKGRITVLNVDTRSLFLAPAERADVVVDFSQYAGKTLLVYNDSGAPVPAGDPRNDLFTGVGDQSGSGGAEDTKPGYGPNIRTMMQIKVKPMVTGAAAAPTTADAFNPAPLQSAVTAAYYATQERPVVAQPAYAGFDPAWTSLPVSQVYGSIYTGSLKDPTFKFTPGTPLEGINSVKVLTAGSGYVQTPLVSISAPALPAAQGGRAATALATMKIDAFRVTAPGTGYTSAPVVTIVGGGGNGATASATLAIDSATVTVQGGGYTSAPTVNFTAAPAGGSKPVATATVVGGKVTAITITTPGTGYTASPLISLTGGGGTGARATSSGGIGAVKLLAPDPAFPITAGGGGYTNMNQLTVTFTGGNGTGAAVAGTGKVFDITLTHPGFGYVAGEVPTITVSDPPVAVGAATATAQADRAGGGGALSSHLIKTKTIQELFDPTYGRLNATFGVELPFTSALTQTTIPLGYVDEVTEKFADGETQIWKITHNGVDTHPVHFHLLNVQLINRVGWDGLISAPLPQEMGWKETIKLSPLEDSIVAVRAKKPTLPGFGLPLSVRAADPSQPLGSPFGFTQIDPATGTPKTVVNDIVNYGWEYTWHCHILGHEENDFMRPVIFNANEAVPLAPTLNTVQPGADGSSAALDFTDNSSTEYKFSVLRAPVDGANAIGAYAEVGTQLANGKDYIDATVTPNLSYSYKVVAIGAAGAAESNAVTLYNVIAPPTAPSNFVATAKSATLIDLSWLDTSNNEAGFLLERSLDGGNTWASVGVVKPIGASGFSYSVPANTASFPDGGYTTNQAVSYRLSAVNALGASPTVSASTTTLGAPALAGLSATASSDTQVALSWSVAANLPANQTVTAYRVTRTTGATSTTFDVPANTALPYIDAGLAQNTAYTYTVSAVNKTGAPPQANEVVGAASTASATTQFALPSNVTGFVATSIMASQVVLKWNGGTPAQTYTITRKAGAGAVTTLPPVTTATGTWTDTTTVAATAYTYTVTAVNGNKVSNTATATVTTPATMTAPTIGTATATTTQVTVNWTDRSTNENRFAIERSKDGGAFVLITTVATGNTANNNNARSFANTTTLPAGFGVVAGSVYTYRVTAQAPALPGATTNQSLPSGTVTLDYSTPVAPTGLTVTRIQRNVLQTTDRVDLSWLPTAAVANRPAVSGYTVEWSTTSNFAAIAGTATAGAAAATLTVNVARGNAATPTPAAYYFRIRANNTVGNGTPSPVLGPVNTL